MSCPAIDANRVYGPEQGIKLLGLLLTGQHMAGQIGLA